MRGLTKTDYMRGCQCPRMLWLDRHVPEAAVIPAATRARLNAGNDFGDAMMGYFGPYTEVRAFLPGTSRPDKAAMAAKTQELLAEKTPVICEAAFLDEEGNYCACDLLHRRDDGTFEMAEVKNSAAVTETFLWDAAFQTWVLGRCGMSLSHIYIIYHAEEPCSVLEVTDEVQRRAEEVAGRIPALRAAASSLTVPEGVPEDDCDEPYGCWYHGWCAMQAAGENGRPRCRWCPAGRPDYARYHDTEWGVPTRDDTALFEKLMLEMFQSGLSFLTVLRKRPAFRAAFCGFAIEQVAAFDEEKKASLMADAGIIRHRGKIDAAAVNARVALDLIRAFGSLAAYLETFTGGETLIIDDPSVTENDLSRKLAADLRKRGMKFVGPTVVYSFLQAAGFIDGHDKGCWKHRG